ncbi:hypothetical protein BIV57_06835 [Mangrovactinospora gilvigrisea]|uniref:histidine kinase n=1 Tax=Mangrovactinospora gilvigrisea TaxID=1428644 RepID=A0A1J7C9Q1_9ACTN|nr:HAMP domain-containing sensor histidine kinase [Mangrovactinospora gilvigrisea]OIV38244.1 hypothetical protein BIV57_06835 [Mangrovactinospora gilvigrisea]
MNLRLSTRLALATAVLVPLLVLGAGFTVLTIAAHDLRAQADRQLRDRITALVPAARGLLAAQDTARPAAARKSFRQLYGAALDIGVRLTGPDGTVRAADGPQPADGSVHTAGWRTRTRRIADPQDGGPAELTVYSSNRAVDRQIDGVRTAVLWTAAGAAPASALLALLVARRAAVPLRRLRDRTAALDPTALSGASASFAQRRTGVAEVDELAAVLHAILTRYDAQAGRTAQALESARSFASAAAHELRTPLASMRPNLDVLAAAGTGRLSEAEHAEIVADLTEQHQRIDATLTALRTLARGELVDTAALRPADLAETVDAAVADLRRRCPGVEVRAELPEQLTLPAWEPGLRILVDNLLGNALVHGRPPITVTLRQEGGDAVLVVQDAGPGIPPAERETVFERFRRRTGSPGSGLGLALAAQQAALHGGTVRAAEAAPLPGARMEVRLPTKNPQGGPLTSGP